MTNENSVGGVATLRTLENGIEVLFLFSEASPRLSVAEVASRTGLREGTAYRYVATLRAYGLLEESTQRGQYQLGTRGLELFSSLLRAQNDVVRIALPVMEDLARQTEETVLLVTIQGQRGVCIEKVESAHTLRVAYERGKTFHLHAGSSGKLLLAYLSDREQRAIVRESGLPKLTANTVTDPDLLFESLKKIRQDGYSVTDGEQLEGIRGISAPILDSSGRIRAGLNVEGPIRRLEGRPTEDATRLTVEAAQAISKRMQEYLV